MAQKFPNIAKWAMNPDIDNELSNNFWSNPIITDPQKTAILKFRTGQYMGNARKQLFFGIQRFPSKHARYVTRLMQTHGYMSYLNVTNTIYTPLE